MFNYLRRKLARRSLDLDLSDADALGRELARAFTLSAPRRSGGGEIIFARPRITFYVVPEERGVEARTTIAPPSPGGTISARENSSGFIGYVLSPEALGRSSVDVTHFKEPFLLDMEAGQLRGVIVGGSGAGKSNLLRVLAEEAYEGGQAVLMLDPEFEHWKLAIESDDRESLRKFGVDPLAYPVRVLAPPAAAEDIESELRGRGDIEVVPIRLPLGWVPDSTLRSLLALQSDTAAAAALQRLLEPGLGVEDLLDKISTAEQSGEITGVTANRLRSLLEALRDFSSGEDFRDYVYDTSRINVLTLHPVHCVNEVARNAYASAIANYIATNREDVTPMLVLIDEAPQIVSSVQADVSLQLAFARLAQMARKRRKSVLFAFNATQISTILRFNVAWSFTFRTTPEYSKKLYQFGFVTETSIPIIQQLPDFSVLIRHETRTWIVAIRPARSFTGVVPHV